MDRLDAAARSIESGRLIVIPTPRWYMLCCNALDSEACAAIFEAKKRPVTKSLLLVMPSAEETFRLFEISPEAETLANNFWPGDLALLLRWKDPKLGESYSAVGAPVGLVGCPSGMLGDLAHRTAVPIAATSANISGPAESSYLGPAISPKEVSAFLEESGADVDLVIQDGICPQFTPMTIIDCSNINSLSRIVREGAIHRRAISVALERTLDI